MQGTVQSMGWPCGFGPRSVIGTRDSTRSQCSLASSSEGGRPVTGCLQQFAFRTIFDHEIAFVRHAGLPRQMLEIA